MKLVYKILAELASFIGAELRGDGDVLITGIGSLESAQSGEISFLADPKYKKFLTNTKASAVILSSADANSYQGNALVVRNPAVAYVKLAKLFEYRPLPVPGIHPTVIIGEGCEIHPSASIAPYTVIGCNVRIDENVVVGSGCFIGDYTEIGANTQLHSNVVIYHKVKIGKRVHIDSSASIGSDGFGLTQEGEKWLTTPQLGTVILEDDVDIGCNATIDRGALGNTVIAKGTKIDNLVLIAHNVAIGEHTAMAGCTAVAGSTKIGSHCLIGGASAISGHLEIADNVAITGMTAVPFSIKESGIYSSGTPATEHRLWKKIILRLLKLDNIARRIGALEAKVEALNIKKEGV